MSVEFRIGDVRRLLAELPAGSVDLIATSWPYHGQRDYLPKDHPMKSFEIGHEPTPAEYISVLLDITAEFRRVLAPHGSIATELGDGFCESGPGWPLARSLEMAPELYRVALAYGIHPLTVAGSPAGRWRVRNVVVHGRPNPPVGALCVDDQTEALTPDGWRKHDQLEDGDLIAAYDPKTDSCRYVPAKFVKWEREGEPMVVIDKRSTSQVMTEDHRCLAKTRKAPAHVRLAKDLTNDCETLLCAPFEDVPGPAPVSVERAALLGWYIAEGTTHHRQAKISQSVTANPEKVAESC